MKKKYLIILSGVIAIVAVFVLAQVYSVRSGPQDPTPTPTPVYLPNSPATIDPHVYPSVVPPKLTDLSPNIPYNDKVAIIVLHSDGTREEFLAPPDMVDAFVKKLPSGDKLLQVISLDIPYPPSIPATVTPGP